MCPPSAHDEGVRSEPPRPYRLHTLPPSLPHAVTHCPKTLSLCRRGSIQQSSVVSLQRALCTPLPTPPPTTTTPTPTPNPLQHRAPYPPLPPLPSSSQSEEATMKDERGDDFGKKKISGAEEGVGWGVGVVGVRVGGWGGGWGGGGGVDKQRRRVH